LSVSHATGPLISLKTGMLRLSNDVVGVKLRQPGRQVPLLFG
jgi:hypothetical protein